MVRSKLPGDPIRHVVHLILENRSFDQMLGCMTSVYSDLDGVDSNFPKSNKDTEGRAYIQAATQIRETLRWDPHHEVPRVAAQLANGNSGFVEDFSQQYPKSTTKARQQIMDYYDLDFLPALHPLARNYKVCDRWFSSLPGPTWPNRFFALTGTSNGRVNMPNDGIHKSDLRGYFQQTQTTLFDRLNEQAVHWKVYFHDVPQTTVLNNQRQPHNVARYFYIDQFYSDARGLETEFPEYCLIEPDYMGYEQNDGHPPHDIMRSEKLIADVYNAIRANQALWDSTLLIVMFDEHGGFYDHVTPPAAIPPDNAQPSEYAFNQLGVRVPAVLISPWIAPGVEHTQFDHTSVLKYLTEKWGLGPLALRTAAANSIGRVVGNAPVENDLKKISLLPEQLQPPSAQAEEEVFGSTNSHQAALACLGQWLEIEAFEKAPRIAVFFAKIVEKLRVVTERYVFGSADGFCVSVAKPDRLSLPLQTIATDSVASFLMRMKRYAAMGLRTRLDEANLAADQQQHSIQTLALITDRKFQHEDAKSAKVWLSERTTRS